ncbi:TM2 domain-containing protein [Sphingomonas faeni]|jgi:TM2 domain-containing membrane protein YozV|uniref:TM2 domain-containing protein n=1 Tax=Sphingomonas faeni TaxID=185950 RepID=UPI00277D6A13|nr:TM2 domain-containing protein [Sphingomonas faeni]MDQ0838207.1 TM2 domain-containing membrane protein YozV [Sphingomonas faeni]
MRGQVLGVDPRTGEGIVAGQDGQRYRFAPEDWAHRGEPAIGIEVDFEAANDRALSVFPMPTAPGPRRAVPPATVAPPTNDRNKYVAAVMAFVIGTLGIHRFYLGRTGSGIIMLVLSITVIGLVISAPWALIDMIRYLMMSDEEFAARYPRKR